MAKEHYVDKKLLLADLTEYRNKCDAAIAAGKPPPRIPESVGVAIDLIARKLATRYNFRGYTFREEMVQDGILDACKAVKNFNPDQSKKNPFGYFNLIIWRAMVRRIKDENAEHDAKIEMMLDPLTQAYDTLTDDHESYDISRQDLSDFYYDGKLM